VAIANKDVFGILKSATATMSLTMRFPLVCVLTKAEKMAAATAAVKMKIAQS
jgi:hypothetical protein